MSGLANTKLHRGDLWPVRDKVCFNVSWDFKACDRAIGHCKKRDLVIQAGGCVGVWPRYLRREFKKVITFEPSPENYVLMEKNLAGLDIEMHQAALGASPSRCGMKTNPQNCGDDRTIEGKEIEVVTIDDLNVSPDLIYLDIQGDEYPALMGALQTIERCNPIIGIEYDRKMSKGDAQGLLIELGYKEFYHHSQDHLFAR